MTRVSKLTSSALNWGKESIRQRAARIRKKRGFTQVELSAKIAVRFPMAPDVTRPDVRPDALLHPNAVQAASRKPSRKVLPRLERMEEPPPTQQATLLRTIDTFLAVAALKTARRTE